MKRIIKVVVVFTILLITITNMQAQQNAEADVKAVVVAMFDAMRAGDSAALGQTFHEELRLATTYTNQQGSPVVSMATAQQFLNSVGTPHDQIWDEKIDSWEIRVSDNLATVWTDYRFFYGTTMMHCGVNAFQLVNTPKGWKIIHITDTRTKDCN